MSICPRRACVSIAANNGIRPIERLCIFQYEYVAREFSCVCGFDRNLRHGFTPCGLTPRFRRG